MANELIDHALQGLPCRVSGTAQFLYLTLCHRFDTRVTLPNGKPNRGHHKSYPGEEALTTATSKSRQAVNKALNELINAGLIVRVTIGKPGQRAEYVPIYSTNALGISVNNTLHKSKKYKARKVADNVNNASTMSKEGLPNVATEIYSISTISNHKYDKYNKERFDKFISLLPKDVGGYITPGDNLDELLDELTGNGWTLEAVCEHLSRKKYNSAYKVGGVVMTHLNELLGRKIINHFEGIKWCGKCPHSTRTYDERSPGVDGKDTNQCTNCHPNQIRIKKRNEIDPFDLGNSLSSFGLNKLFELPE